jgi:transcriptional antiterminator NusG
MEEHEDEIKRVGDADEGSLVAPSEGGAEDAAEEAAGEESSSPKTKRPKKKGPEPQMKQLDPRRAALPWYVVHTYSGFEGRARTSLEERIRLHGLDESFGNILVPQETVVELVKGQKRTSTRKFFPGYILVQMELNDNTWHLVKETPKITGFVGDARNPSPLTTAEVDVLTKQMEGGVVKPRPKVQFEEGDAIKVIDGPFADFNGTVDEVKPDKGKLRVLISIFGRNTPVELDFVQVEKI